jgi:transcriptional regulator with XRE-family HTH domain
VGDLLNYRDICLLLWRVRNGLTEAEVADLTGLSESMASLTECGPRRLAPLTKARVARCLGVPIRDLFDVEEIDEPETAAG